ncbi:inositol monophosphatase family protein [Thioalkalivibrio sp. HK1]|uniref:inositol monophosphatase family protein n=1 Tax=Thioalkalivibrio sp. HK1 TaxID=1469245 RepID=UPI0004B7B0F5|nr:inositol monophosphatase family protein [Thioalkalivibrio sp. HK1]
MNASIGSGASVDREIVEFARHLADCAGDMIRRAVQDEGREIRPLDKDDGSPVTSLDREVEVRLRESIRKRYPEHGIIGEEFGADRPGAEHVWVLDPIDGTKAFMAQVPVYGTLISLARDRHPVLGVVDHPLLCERWTGIAGEGTWCNDKRIRLGETPRRLEETTVAISSPDSCIGEDACALQRLVEASKWRVYGGNCYGIARVSSGHVNIALESRAGIYDYCALLPVVTNAGGVMSGWKGETLTIDIVPGGRILASNNHDLHRQAMACLSGEGEFSR